MKVLSIRNQFRLNIALIDKNVNTNEVKGFLVNPREFEKLIIDSNKELNFILNRDQQIFDIFKEVSNNKQSHNMRISTKKFTQWLVSLMFYFPLESP